MEHPFFINGTTNRAEALRWLTIAEKLLTNRDLIGSKSFAIRARESDPTFLPGDQILAILDTLIAGDNRINNQHLDWYSILQVPPNQTHDSELIANQYRRLALLLNPQKNNFSFSGQAFQLVVDAWSVLSNPFRKSVYDKELGFFLNLYPVANPTPTSASSTPNLVSFMQPSSVRDQSSVGFQGHDSISTGASFSRDRAPFTFLSHEPQSQSVTFMPSSSRDQQQPQYVTSMPSSTRDQQPPQYVTSVPSSSREQQNPVTFFSREQPQPVTSMPSSSREQQNTFLTREQPQPVTSSSRRDQQQSVAFFSQEPPQPVTSMPSWTRNQQQPETFLSREQPQPVTSVPRSSREQQQPVAFMSREQPQPVTSMPSWTRNQQQPETFLSREQPQPVTSAPSLSREQQQPVAFMSREQPQHVTSVPSSSREQQQPVTFLSQEQPQPVTSVTNSSREQQQPVTFLSQEQPQPVTSVPSSSGNQQQSVTFLSREQPQPVTSVPSSNKEQHPSALGSSSTSRQQPVASAGQQGNKQTPQRNEGLVGNNLNHSASTSNNMNNVKAKEGSVDVSSHTIPSFWTACPYCYLMYEYPLEYADCTLRCQNCKRASQAVKIPSPPPIIDGKEAYFCCWGFMPLGFSSDLFEKNRGNVSSWTPFAPMFTSPQTGGGNGGGYENQPFGGQNNVNNFSSSYNAGGSNPEGSRKQSAPRIYVDDDDVFVEISESSDESDEDWDKKRKKAKSGKRKSARTGTLTKKAKKQQPDKRKSVKGNTGDDNQVASTQGGVEKPNVVAESIKKGVASNMRKQSGRSAKDFGKLDLNVEFSNEVEEPPPRMAQGNGFGRGEDIIIEEIGFFEGLDEFLSNLPILNVVG